MTAPLLVTAVEMRAIEEDAAGRGASWQELMDRAGKQVANLALEWLGSATKQNVLVLAGPGNNGGDALVAARHLANHGWPVRCFTWSRNSEKDTRLREPLQARGVSAVPLLPESYQVELSEALSWCSVVIDGLLGTGLKRDIEGDLARIIEMVAASYRSVVAVDIPTGVDSDTGAVCGVALPADFTVALGHLKYGHAVTPGAILSGKTVVGDIGLNEQASRQNASGELFTDDSIARLLPKRPDDANKGTFGKAMVVAGSVNYIGAAALATEGAMRAGAGLVTLGCAGDLMPILATKLTENTFLLLPSDLGAIATHAAEKLLDALEGYTALLVGCGIGKDKGTSGFLKGLLSAPDNSHTQPAARSMGFASRAHQETPPEEKKTGLPPLVLDGDALNILSEWEGWSEHVPPGSILTPHPGEMARLLGSTVEEVQADRVKIAKDAAAKWNQVLVLKGAGTVVAAPKGKLFVSPFSNPALATAGTGDVLAGAIVGLLAQGLAPVDAACVGVYLHGMAGEALRDEYGPSGGLAGGLPVLLALAGRRLRENGSAKRA